MKTFISAWWVASIPDRWIVSESEDCVTFSPTTNVALQISATRKEAGFVTETDIMDFAGGKGKEANPIATPSLSGIWITYTKGARYWREYWLRDADILFYITFHCEEREQSQWHCEIDAIIRSLHKINRANGTE